MRRFEEEMPYIAHSTDFAAIREQGIEDFLDFSWPSQLARVREPESWGQSGPQESVLPYVI
jgi:hypothetical protein